MEGSLTFDSCSFLIHFLSSLQGIEDWNDLIDYTLIWNVFIAPIIWLINSVKWLTIKNL